jgi:hypothetical protein
MDSDTDISLGLSPEEEEQLLDDLAAKFPAFHNKKHPATVKALDSLPERVEHVVSGNAQPGAAELLTPGEDRVITPGSTTGEPLAVTIELPAFPSPVSINQEVVYPNCKFRAMEGRLPKRLIRLT